MTENQCSRRMNALVHLSFRSMATSDSPAEFFTSLHSSGIASVTREKWKGEVDGRVLQQAFEEGMEDFPGDVAGLEWPESKASDSLQFFYRLCQALVDRAMTDEEVTLLCAELPPVPSTPGEILAVDLPLRHLPELHGMAKSMSSGDPLVTGIEAAARRFPLSSVGIALEEPLPHLSMLQHNSGLWRLYIDRVIERQDVSRLADGAVRLAVVDALGEHALKLAPKLSAHLALISPPNLPISQASHSTRNS